MYVHYVPFHSLEEEASFCADARLRRRRGLRTIADKTYVCFCLPRTRIRKTNG